MRKSKNLQDGLRLRDAKIAWVLPSLGEGGSLLYHKPMLESLAVHCRSFRVFTAYFRGAENGLGFEVEHHGIIKRFYYGKRQSDQWNDIYGREIRLITPTVIPALLKYCPDLMVVTEFSLWSFYAVLARYLMPGTRVLLLVETKPRFDQSSWIWLLRKAIRIFIVKQADMYLTNNQDGENYLISDLQASVKRVIVRPFLVSDMANISGKSKENLYVYRGSREIKFPVRFLYVGRLIQLKGLQYALEALAALLQEYAGRFVLDVVGDGPFREILERQTQKLGLSRQVLFHGRQPYTTLWKWYLRADVFLFPTLGDYRALAPFEALSMGLPLVSSVHDGGVNETVDAGRNGFSCDPRDTATLATILARFIETPQIIIEFGKRSLEMALAYTLQRATESLVYACQRTLDSNSESFLSG